MLLLNKQYVPAEYKYIISNYSFYLSQRFLGEVFELDDTKLELFDKLEQHPEHYTRTPIKVSQHRDYGNTCTNPASLDIFL